MHALRNPVSCKCEGDRTQFEATMLVMRKETHVVSVVSVTGVSQYYDVGTDVFYTFKCEAQ
jgi:hypothetical protein